MANANLTMGVKGVDKTAAAFKSVQWRAKATGAQIRAALGGALAAAGAYLGLRSIKAGVDELGHLSDIAQKTSASVDELTQTVTAFGVLGIQNMSVEQLGKAFDYMAKTTGRTGMAGFYQTIDELGKIPDVALRGQEAMRIFGSSGMEFMPLINGADETVNALKTVVAAMPAIPQSAANAGDAMSDAMSFAANQAKSIWLQGLGAICGWLDNEYKGGAREASLAAGNYVEYFTKVAVAKALTYWHKLQNGIKAISDTIMSFGGAVYEKFFGTGGSWADVFANTASAWDSAWKEYDDAAEELERREEERTERFARTFNDRKIAIEHFQDAYNKAAISIKDRKEREAEAEDMAAKAPNVRNDLMLAGSNAANRAALLGPQLQAENKKQTALLGKIAANTENMKQQETYKELD